MNKNLIRVIFSDLFGVLIGPNYSQLVQYVKDVTSEDDEIIYSILFDEENMRFIRGEIDFKKYFFGIQYKIKNGSNINFDKFNFFWNSMKIDIMEPANDLLKRKEKYKLAIVTNTSSSHIKLLKKKFTFLNDFDSIITSDISKSMKPENTIFEYSSNLMNIKPHESLFIDDTCANIYAANKLGMLTHHYKQYESFRSFIDKF